MAKGKARTSSPKNLEPTNKTDPKKDPSNPDKDHHRAKRDKEKPASSKESNRKTTKHQYPTKIERQKIIHQSF